MRTSLYASLALAVIAGPAGAGTFYDVGVPSGQLTSLSHDGRIAGGVIGGEAAFRWNKDRGAVPLTGFVSSYGMNSWAQPMAGAYTPDGDIANASAALAFSNSDLVGGPVVIGGYPGTGGGFGTGISEAYGISDTGIAVGLAYDETNNPIAFRWTEGGGMTRLPVNRTDTYSRANGISDNGLTIYGWNDQADGFRSGVIWRGGATIDLVDAGGNPLGEALAANAGGSVVVGAGYETQNGSEAWRWTAATGAQPIGLIAAAPLSIKGRSARYQPPAVRSERADAKLGTGPKGFFPPAAYAFAVSNDGNVIVGASGAFPARHAFVWTPAGGMELLSDYAAARGVTIPAGWDLNTADAISADGKTIGGWGLGPSGIASFVIDLHDDTPREALVEARGTVAYNDLSSGPFAGVPAGTAATLKFRLSPEGFEIEPGQDTRYPIDLDTFALRAGSKATETLVATAFGPNVDITNDYPMSDGIHLFSTPTASGQAFEFELFNPGGNLFDSDDLARVNRTFGPQFFEKTSWIVEDGDEMMYVELKWVRISEYPSHPGIH